MNELPILSDPYNTGYETCSCVRDPQAPPLPAPPPPPPPSGGNVMGGYAGGPGDVCTTCNPPGTKPRPIRFQ